MYVYTVGVGRCLSVAMSGRRICVAVCFDVFVSFAALVCAFFFRCTRCLDSTGMMVGGTRMGSG